MDGFRDALLADDVLIKLLLALLLGGLIGLERELKGRAAGLRTHVLVCMGATILIISARHVGQVFGGELEAGRLVLDPNRLAAGIVTGIGFLGAGAILRMGDLVRGLTTGACIWFVAAVGIVVGNGLYPLAIASTVVVLIVLELFGFLERYIPGVIYRGVVVTLALEQREEFESWCREFLVSRGLRIQETLTRVDTREGVAEVTFRVRARGALHTRDLVQRISGRPGVSGVEVEQG